MAGRNVLVINPRDNVAIALRTLAPGEPVLAEEGGEAFPTLVEIPLSHKVALADIPQGGAVIKYGECIGNAACDIRRGEWVHRHNLDAAQIFDKYVEDMLGKFK